MELRLDGLGVWSSFRHSACWEVYWDRPRYLTFYFGGRGCEPHPSWGGRRSDSRWVMKTRRLVCSLWPADRGDGGPSCRVSRAASGGEVIRPLTRPVCMKAVNYGNTFSPLSLYVLFLHSPSEALSQFHLFLSFTFWNFFFRFFGTATAHRVLVTSSPLCIWSARAVRILSLLLHLAHVFPSLITSSTSSDPNNTKQQSSWHSHFLNSPLSLFLLRHRCSVFASLVETSWKSCLKVWKFFSVLVSILCPNRLLCNNSVNMENKIKS